jgi:O-antigen/teichoic acid export membrane protein
MLLDADQKSYIFSIVQTVSIIINTLFVVVLIKMNAGIHVVRLGSSLIFLLRPIILNLYVKKHYNIARKCKPDTNSISQRWDGFGHTIAYFIHNKTDVALLTVFSGLKIVSVYSVYILVTTGITSLVTLVSAAVQAAFGDMIARKEYRILDKNFKSFECLIHMITVAIFTTAAILIIPFILLYTRNFIDSSSYIRPTFAYIIIAAEGIYCIRQPYHSIIISAGHYKQTRKGAFFEAGINIIVSLILVIPLGMIGVAIGTLVAMTFRTIDYALYLRKNIIFIAIGSFIKRMGVSAVNVSVIYIICHSFSQYEMSSFFVWTEYALITMGLAVLITIAVNLIFYKNEVINIYQLLCHLIFKRDMKTL